MLYFRNNEFYVLLENEKRAIDEQPFSHIVIYFRLVSVFDSFYPLFGLLPTKSTLFSTA